MKDDNLAAVALVLFVVFGSMFGGFLIGRDYMKQEAIKNGAAERVMVNQVTGKTEVRWKVAEKGQTND